jgi:surface antigen
MNDQGRAKTMILVRLMAATVVTGLFLSTAAAQGINPFSRDGFSLSKSDIAQLEAATKPFYEDVTVPLGTSRAWSNPESGNQGTAKLVERFEYKKLPCRRIQHDIKLKKMADPYHFVIDRCQVADGSWKFL